MISNSDNNYVYNDICMERWQAVANRTLWPHVLYTWFETTKSIRAAFSLSLSRTTMQENYKVCSVCVVWCEWGVYMYNNVVYVGVGVELTFTSASCCCCDFIVCSNAVTWSCNFFLSASNAVAWSCNFLLSAWCCARRDSFSFVCFCKSEANLSRRLNNQVPVSWNLPSTVSSSSLWYSSSLLAWERVSTLKVAKKKMTKITVPAITILFGLPPCAIIYSLYLEKSYLISSCCSRTNAMPGLAANVFCLVTKRFQSPENSCRLFCREFLKTHSCTACWLHLIMILRAKVCSSS